LHLLAFWILRDVAIKILPADYAKDPDRLQRFEQEAQAVGILNQFLFMTPECRMVLLIWFQNMLKAKASPQNIGWRDSSPKGS
jgi:hypothetical protein